MKSIKKLALILMLIVGAESCDKITNVKFSQTSTSADFLLKSGIPADVYKDTIDLNYDLQNVVQSNGSSIDRLKEIKLSAGKAVAQSGNFDNWDNLSVSIMADGLPTQNMMSKIPVLTPTGLELEMDVNTTTDFLPYFKGDNIKLKVNGKLKKETTGDQIINFTLTSSIKAGL